MEDLNNYLNAEEVILIITLENEILTVNYNRTTGDYIISNNTEKIKLIISSQQGIISYLNRYLSPYNRLTKFEIKYKIGRISSDKFTNLISNTIHDRDKSDIIVKVIHNGKRELSVDRLSQYIDDYVNMLTFTRILNNEYLYTTKKIKSRYHA